MRKKKGIPLMVIGLLLCAAALSLGVYNVWDDNRASDSVDITIQELNLVIPDPEEAERERPEGMIPDYILSPEMEMPEVEVADYDYIGYLEIPALDLSLPVMREWSYPLLKIAPCRYSGSVYLDNMVIAAHNYKRHFGGLKNLGVGDEICFVDVDGNAFWYTVEEMEQLNPNETREMISSDWDLTLFTCTLGGQFRFTVRCSRVEETGAG